MYAFTESAGACVALNQKQPVERRRMSLAHEFGHFLTSRFQSETLMEDRYERRPKAEIFAEAFARAFLMTSSGIRRRFIDLQRERSGALSRGDLLRLANRFEVSAEAMVRRLEELRLIPGGTWDRLQAEGLRIRDAQRLLGIQPVRDEDPLPERYVALAVEAWEAGELSEGQVARLLRESRLDVRNRLARDHEARDLGLGSQLGLPLVAAAGG
jgi:Zn-dependent peptidase ImmA (M78 family)